jgi:hypothetical protein
MNDFDILDEMEQMINRTKQVTVGYTHAEIFEILKRRFEEIKFELMVEEYKKRLPVKVEHKTTA